MLLKRNCFQAQLVAFSLRGLLPRRLLADNQMPQNCLSSDQVETLRVKLLELEETLIEFNTLQAQSRSEIELDQSRVGRLSRMDALANAAMSQETSRRRAVRLKRVKNALQKIKMNNYGECDECLEFIQYERLVLDPAAQLCITCATLKEKQ